MLLRLMMKAGGNPWLSKAKDEVEAEAALTEGEVWG